MKTILKALGQRVREIAYLLISFPVSVLLFCFVILGFTSGIALPFAVLIFLFLLTIMEKISSFEIKRANKMLKTDFIVTDNWFSHPFSPGMASENVLLHFVVGWLSGTFS